MDKAVCPQCGYEEIRPDARFCWRCGYQFEDRPAMSERQIMVDAINTYGEVHQMLVAIEEMAELIKELCKRYRGFDNLSGIAEEIADVSVVTDEMLLIFDCFEQVRQIRTEKLGRLHDTMHKDTEGEELPRDKHEKGRVLPKSGVSIRGLRKTSGEAERQRFGRKGVCSKLWRRLPTVHKRDRR